MAVAIDEMDRLDELIGRRDRLQNRQREIKAQLAEVAEEIADVRRVLAQRGRPPRPTSTLDPHVQAGHAATDMLRVFRRARRPLRMADAAERAGVGSGTSTWAIRALEADRMIEPTGERIRRSPVYRVTERGRVTRLEPGQ